MVTKNQIKLISSLHQKKFRQLNQLFIAEGVKVIQELISARFEVVYIFETTTLFSARFDFQCEQVTDEELKKMSALTVPNNCLAVFKMPVIQAFQDQGLILALDGIRDPGNLGTIIRICDWFGIQHILCSPDTVDLYNPKVVQASMGSIGRVQCSYLDLASVLKNTSLPVLGTFMDGAPIYKTNLPSEGIIVMGNEANGITPEIENLINTKITIPRFGPFQKTESLNVATATAIILSEFCRKL